MIQGTASNVGKSLLTVGLCRIYARRGLRVAPFKAQNMALNSFLIPGGGEIGRAQALQAAAAGISPRLDMNPILLKPLGDSRSQVVLWGKVWKTLPAAEYYRERPFLWKAVQEALESLKADHDLIIIEGAGSPAEINLKENEIVNMRVARHLEAPVVLTGDIDRGGVFAFLHGTLALLEPEERELVKGFIINKFRGDPALLQPGLEMLRDLTGGRPTLGVVPYIKDIRLAQEDSLFLDEAKEARPGDSATGALGSNGPGRSGGAPPAGVDIAVVRLPRMANYDDFDPLATETGVALRFIDSVSDLGPGHPLPQALIIPGTAAPEEDLGWLRERGLAAALSACGQLGSAVLGIGAGRGILEAVFGTQGRELPAGAPHGVFDAPDFRRRWLQNLGWSASGPPRHLRELREEEFRRLADHLESHLAMGLLDRIIGI